jgi:O-acetyl-ADP-ribose deacetylase (regulator of RNase III)
LRASPERLGTLPLPAGRSFEVVLGDLLVQDVDCIVNAANGMLAHGGGVAAAISRAAGPALDEEGRRMVAERGPLATGEGVATTAGKRPHSTSRKRGAGARSPFRQ